MCLYKTKKLRIKDKYAKHLHECAREVNFVWNYVRNLSNWWFNKYNKFPSAFDLHPYLSGSAKECCLHSETIQSVVEEYCRRRKQFKKRNLRYRCSNNSKSNYSLGWIPFKGSTSIVEDTIRFAKKDFKFWNSYNLTKETEIVSGSFNEDSQGRWYVNLVVKEMHQPNLVPEGNDCIGIDLGVSTLATISDGAKIENPRLTLKYETRLAEANRKMSLQLERSKRYKTKFNRNSQVCKTVRKIHQKIRNKRLDWQHKESTKLVARSACIIVGDLKSQSIIDNTTTSNKSIYDAAWFQFKTLLKYKCDYAAVEYVEVNEAYTSMTCNVCETIPSSAPKGEEGVSIRRWECSNCGAIHDRDINAAINIKKRGLSTMNSKAESILLTQSECGHTLPLWESS